MEHEQTNEQFKLCSNDGILNGSVSRNLFTFSAIVGLIITPTLILIDESFMDISTTLESVPAAISNGLIPFMIILLLFAGYFQFVKKKFKTNKSETIQSVFVLILVIFIVLTVTSIVFRGEGMALTFPWN